MTILLIKQPTIATQQRIARIKALARLKQHVCIVAQRKASLHGTKTITQEA